MVRGVRGATTVERDEASEVLEATRELLAALLHANDLVDFDSIAAVHFTVTDDVHSTFPAEAAWELGMNMVPLICHQEMSVPGRLPRCIRVLMLVNTRRGQDEMRHVYLREATSLRPDLRSAQ
jgi:chorismate mutase